MFQLVADISKLLFNWSSSSHKLQISIISCLTIQSIKHCYTSQSIKRVQIRFEEEEASSLKYWRRQHDWHFLISFVSNQNSDIQIEVLLYKNDFLLNDGLMSLSSIHFPPDICYKIFVLNHSLGPTEPATLDNSCGIFVTEYLLYNSAAGYFSTSWNSHFGQSRLLSNSIHTQLALLYSRNLSEDQIKFITNNITNVHNLMQKMALKIKSNTISSNSISNFRYQHKSISNNKVRQKIKQQNYNNNTSRNSKYKSTESI